MTLDEAVRQLTDLRDKVGGDTLLVLRPDHLDGDFWSWAPEGAMPHLIVWPHSK